MSYELSGKRIWVAGHRGMVGGAVARRLAREKCEVLTAGRDVVDLIDQAAVRAWMAMARPDAIVIAAARVGGIHANDTRPVDFLYDNLMIEANIMQAAHEAGVERLLFLGSSCIYPKFAPQPIAEDALLTGPLEPTNEWYAVAKIAGIKLCQAYRRQYGRDWISAMPTNLYGRGDNYDLESSHVLPALLRKFHDARVSGRREVPVWGRERRCGNFFIATISPTRWCSCSGTTPDTSISTSARARKSRSGILPRPSHGSLAATRNPSSTLPNPTARRASSWTVQGCAPWAGTAREISKPGSGKPTLIS